MSLENFIGLLGKNKEGINVKILVMGLPGSGKTYLSERLAPLIDAAWYNADKVREMAGDWDFSSDGRIRQS